MKIASPCSAPGKASRKSKVTNRSQAFTALPNFLSLVKLDKAGKVDMLEPIEDQYQQIGHIARSHGVQGEVLIISQIGAPQLFDEIDLVHIQNTRGDLFPARIESFRVQQKNNRLSFFVKFEHVPDRNRAEKLKGFPVYVMQERLEPILPENQKNTVDYTGFDIVNIDEDPEGTVTDVMQNPAHLILEITLTGGKQLLVPFVDEYVNAVDEEQGIITCQNLNRLTDL